MATSETDRSKQDATNDQQPGINARHVEDEEQEAFPWHIGIYDAHCHPTDSMHAIPDLAKMKARVLTIMATRFQDQHLVAQVADEYTQKMNTQTAGATVLPSFGYHPWFSHLIYDDLEDGISHPPSKIEHYTNVLTSAPVDPDLAASLPEPTSLSQILAQTRANLVAHPEALLGEVGLDRTFRIPHGETWRDESERNSESNTVDRAAGLTPGTHHSHPLTKHRVKPAHQIRILQAQLRLTGELNRASSVHVVGGQGAAFDAMRELWKGHEVEVQNAKTRKMMWRKKGDPTVVEEEDEDEEGRSMKRSDPKPYPPRICLHSFSGPPETIQQYLHPSIPVKFFFSFSEAINFSLPEHQQSKSNAEELDPASARALAALKTVPEDRILIESDLHICGDRMDGLLQDIVRRLCQARDWKLEDGVRKLAENWKDFVFGSNVR